MTKKENKINESANKVNDVLVNNIVITKLNIYSYN